MKRRFKVPIRHWAFSEGLAPGVNDFVEAEMSDAYVLETPGGVPSDGIEVVEVRQRRKLFPIPLYKFVWEGPLYPGFRVRQRESHPIRPIRLGLLKPTTLCFVEKPLLREQVVWFDGVLNHYVSDWGSGSCMIACRDDFMERNPKYRVGIPDCPRCIKRLPKFIWTMFVVQEYEHPAVVEKAEHKIKAKARVRARFPTAHDRIVTDWLED